MNTEQKEVVVSAVDTDFMPIVEAHTPLGFDTARHLRGELMVTLHNLLGDKKAKDDHAEESTTTFDETAWANLNAALAKACRDAVTEQVESLIENEAVSEGAIPVAEFSDAVTKKVLDVLLCEAEETRGE